MDFGAAGDKEEVLFTKGMQAMQGLQIKIDYAKGGRTRNATLKTEDAEDGEDAEVAQNKLKCCFES